MADLPREQLDDIDALMHPATPQAATLTESHLGGDAIARLGAMVAAYPALMQMARRSLDLAERVREAEEVIQAQWAEWLLRHVADPAHEEAANAASAALDAYRAKWGNHG